MSDKTFVFTPEAGASGGGLNSILAMIPGMMKGNGLDPNLVAALMNGNKNQDAWGGGGCWWLWIIVLFWLWGGNGFGNNRNGGGLPAELNNDAGRELLMSAIQGNGAAINQLAGSLTVLLNSYKVRCVTYKVQSIRSVVRSVCLHNRLSILYRAWVAQLGNRLRVAAAMFVRLSKDKARKLVCRTVRI